MLCADQRDIVQAMELARNEMEIIVTCQRAKIASYRAKAMNPVNIPPVNQILLYQDKS